MNDGYESCGLLRQKFMSFLEFNENQIYISTNSSSI